MMKIVILILIIIILIAIGALLHPAMIIPALILLKIADIFREGFMQGYQQAGTVNGEKAKHYPQTERWLRLEDGDILDIEIGDDEPYLPEKAKRR